MLKGLFGSILYSSCPSGQEEELCRCLQFRGKTWFRKIMNGEAFANVPLSDEWRWFVACARATQLAFDDPTTSKDLFLSSLHQAMRPEHRHFLLREIAFFHLYILHEDLPEALNDEYQAHENQVRGESQFNAVVNLLVGQPMPADDLEAAARVGEFLEYLFEREEIYCLLLKHVIKTAWVLCAIESRLWNSHFPWKPDRFALAIETLRVASKLCPGECEFLDRNEMNAISRAEDILVKYLAGYQRLQFSQGNSLNYQGAYDLIVILLHWMRLAARLGQKVLLGEQCILAALHHADLNYSTWMQLEESNRPGVVARLQQSCRDHYSSGRNPDHLPRIVTIALDAMTRGGDNETTSGHLLWGCLHALDKESADDLRRLGLNW